MRVFVAIAVLAIVASASPFTALESELLFTKWMEQHGKTYEHDEFFPRFEIFKSNLEMVRKHNEEGHDWTMAMNEFGDLTWEEFRSTHIGFGGVPQRSWEADYNDFAGAPVANDIDWTTKGAVTPVKNQGQCGSCWAFSTTGGLEGAYFLKNNELKSFSEQMLVSCDHNGDQGCNGGLMDNAFAWIQKNGGICSESDYPYEGVTGTCKTSCTVVPGTKPAKWTDVAKTQSALEAAVTQQPVSIAIEADQSGFQFYSSGVFTGSCGTSLDHGVLAVGFGTENGKDYWKVKNSWGSSWGDQGYIKMQRGKSQQGGQCGILLSASYPTL